MAQEAGTVRERLAAGGGRCDIGGSELRCRERRESGRKRGEEGRGRRRADNGPQHHVSSMQATTYQNHLMAKYERF